MQPIASTSNVPIQMPGVSQPAATAVTRPADTLLRSEHTEPSESQIKHAIDAANAALKQVTTDLEFARDAATGKIVVRIIDASTQQVIRQFPSEEMLAIARALDRFEGLLIKQKA
ncbi:MAG: flagellar protein FlaG [Betaproteobacteria bacterium]|nr:flagellar protein FlaG [Betaproteobacteria bacterium]